MSTDETIHVFRARLLVCIKAFAYGFCWVPLVVEGLKWLRHHTKASSVA